MRGKGYYVKYTIKIIDGMLLIINGGWGLSRIFCGRLGLSHLFPRKLFLILVHFQNFF